MLLTWGFVQAGLDVVNFGCLHRCALVRAGRDGVGLLVVILYFYFFIGFQFRAGQSTVPCLHKALFVSSNNYEDSILPDNHFLDILMQE
jgi:hypothetical protein